MSFLDTLMHLRKSFEEHGWKIAIPLAIGCVVGGVVMYRWDSRQLAILETQAESAKQETETQKDRLRQLQDTRDDRISILEKQASEAHQEADTASRQLANAEHELAQLQGKFDLLNDQNHNLEMKLEKYKEEEAEKNADPVQALIEYINGNSIPTQDAITVSVVGTLYAIVGTLNQSETICTLTIKNLTNSTGSNISVRKNQSVKFQFDGKAISLFYRTAVCDSSYMNNDDCAVLACDFAASRE